MQEAHWMMIVGVVLLPLAISVFRKPDWFMQGRAAQRWQTVLGKDKTLFVIRYISSTALLLIGLFLLYYGYTKL